MVWPRRVSSAVLIIIFTCAFIATVGWPKTAEKTQSKPEDSFPKLEIPLAAESPRIDGVVDDAAWKNPPLPLGDWLSYNPVYGKQIVQRTQVWAVYDQHKMGTPAYFAGQHRQSQYKSC